MQAAASLLIVEAIRGQENGEGLGAGTRLASRPRSLPRVCACYSTSHVAGHPQLFVPLAQTCSPPRASSIIASGQKTLYQCQIARCVF